MGMDWVQTVALLVVANAIFAGVNVFYKLAVNDGMSMRILVAYRFMFASAFMIPLAFYLERKRRPKMTWKIAFQGSLCGLFGGALGQNLYIGSLVLTSATFVSAMANLIPAPTVVGAVGSIQLVKRDEVYGSNPTLHMVRSGAISKKKKKKKKKKNLIPAITFVLAVIFRLEKLGIGSKEGNAKVLGTILGISGAMVLTFYKGVEINIWSTNINLLKNHAHQILNSGEYRNRLLGSFLALASCISYSLWLIIQARLSRSYPCHYSSTALMCFSSALLSAIYAMCVEKDWSAWKLGWNIRLLSVAYTGVVASGLVVAMLALCLHKKGPLFVSIFNPLMLVFVAILGSLLLEEKLHLGVFLGSVLIILGLYAVLWGKRVEMKKMPPPEEDLP